ncbi:Hypothetical predicted protein [Pelobates cultripes]|uniref:Uncharacterized protein n=1 Tax=Pelobates cultripes TaxID=61616 RepID=A0AAD1RJT3_PELCU|nr:Hypothetical predicted protein [Pelobates cultripes]
MSSSISHSFAQALINTKDPSHYTRLVVPELTDTPQAVQDGAIPPLKKVTGRAKSSRNWKRVHAREDKSNSNLMMCLMTPIMPPTRRLTLIQKRCHPLEPLTLCLIHGTITLSAGVGYGIPDPQGCPLFDSYDLRHPCYAEWDPPERIEVPTRCKDRFKITSLGGRGKNIRKMPLW